MKKKIILVLTLILAVFVLAACSSGGGSESGTNVTESQEAVEVLNDFEKAASQEDSDQLLDTISDNGISLTIGEETKKYSKAEFEEQLNTLADSNYFNVVNKESTKTDNGITITGELSSTYAAYSMLEETAALDGINFKPLKVKEIITAGVYSGEKFSLETPADWFEYSSKEGDTESYLASAPDKLANVISLYKNNMFSNTYSNLDDLTDDMILTLQSFEDSSYSPYISDLSYQISDTTINSLPAKELAANYDYNYFPTKVVFSLEKIDDQYYITKVTIKSSDNLKKIELKEKIHLIKDNYDFYMIDYAAEKNDFNSSVNAELIDSFKSLGSSNALPEINISEAIDDLNVSLTGDVTDSDSKINKLTINWGDGDVSTLNEGFSSVSEEHFYSDPGDYTIRLTAEDSQGGSSEKELPITLVSDNNYGTSLDLSDGSGNLTVKSNESQTLAIIYPQDDLGDYHNISSFETDALDSAQSKTNIVNNAAAQRRDRSSEGFKYPHDGSEVEYLRELREETLKNYRSASVVQRVSDVSAAPEVGDQETFTVFDGMSKDYSSIKADLRGIGENVLVWTDNSINFSSDNVDKIIDEFDNNIYSTVQQYFGQEPQTDNYAVLNSSNEKVNILITPLLTDRGEVWAGGYFNAADLFSKSKFPDSNERKMMYIHHYADRDNLDYQLGTISHEFQHMIFYNQRVIYNNRLDSATWLNEGFAQVAEDIIGYGYQDGLGISLTPFLENPQDTSLLVWENNNSNYNMSYLFARYLYDRFGAGIIEGVHQIGGDYKNAVAEYTGLSFRSIFRDFAFALWLDDDNSSRYGFPSIDFPSPQPNKVSAGESWTNQKTRGWGINYTLIENYDAEEVTIDIEGADHEGDYYLNILDK